MVRQAVALHPDLDDAIALGACHAQLPDERAQVGRSVIAYTIAIRAAHTSACAGDFFASMVRETAQG